MPPQLYHVDIVVREVQLVYMRPVVDELLEYISGEVALMGARGEGSGLVWEGEEGGMETRYK